MYEDGDGVCAPEWFVPSPPMFAETPDGFALTDAAVQLLAAMDPPPSTPPSTSSTPPPPSVIDRVADLQAQAARLAAELPTAARAMPACDLLDTVQALQQTVNQLTAMDQAVVAELDRQGVHEPVGATSTADLLVQQLRVRPAEATRRVATARACTPRVGLDGQLLPAPRPQVAAAQTCGDISGDHAAVIDRALTALPAGLPADTVDEVEAILVALARTATPADVAAAGRRARDVFDPDGPEPRDQRQRRRRHLTLSQRDDGAGILHGELTAGLLLKLQTLLSPLAAPQPDANGDDTRSPGQRRHDALEDACDRLLHSGTLPDTGGAPTCVAVTITETDLRERTGRVRTDVGTDISITELLHLACDAEVIPVVLNDAGGIMSHGRSKRFATPAQTKALRARDHGCAFPGCTRPPPWCQRHHVTEWTRDHGDTDIDTMCLLCTHHHHTFEQWGWTVHMRDGVPWWTPPPHLDPDQTPIQNTAHHIDITFTVTGDQ